MKRNQKWKIPHTFLQRQTLCFSTYKNPKVKVKLWVRAREKKDIFYTVYFVRRKLFNICVLSQYIVYWIYFQNIHTFTYHKHYFIHFRCLFLKLSEAFSVFLREILKVKSRGRCFQIFLRILYFKSNNSFK